MASTRLTCVCTWPTVGGGDVSDVFRGESIDFVKPEPEKGAEAVPPLQLTLTFATPVVVASMEVVATARHAELRWCARAGDSVSDAKYAGTARGVAAESSTVSKPMFQVKLLFFCFLLAFLSSRVCCAPCGLVVACNLRKDTLQRLGCVLVQDSRSNRRRVVLRTPDIGAMQRAAQLRGASPGSAVVVSCRQNQDTGDDFVAATGGPCRPVPGGCRGRQRRQWWRSSRRCHAAWLGGAYGRERTWRRWWRGATGSASAVAGGWSRARTGCRGC